MNDNIVFQDPFSILESIINVSSSHKNIDQISNEDVL